MDSEARCIVAMLEAWVCVAQGLVQVLVCLVWWKNIFMLKYFGCHYRASSRVKLCVCVCFPKLYATDFCMCKKSVGRAGEGANKQMSRHLDKQTVQKSSGRQLDDNENSWE